MSWSDHIIELEGKAFSPWNEVDGTIDLNEPRPGVVKWKMNYTVHLRRERECQSVSVNVVCLSPCKVYLEDGGLTFVQGGQRNGVEWRNFVRGPILDLPNDNNNKWVKVFGLSEVPCSTPNPSRVVFKVRVSYRLEKGFSCKCHACDACLACEVTPPNLPPLNQLGADFLKLLFSTESSDVTFKVGQESISAHQLVLSTRVPYFRRLFATELPPLEAISKVITIEDADAVFFKEFLKFIYSGEPPKDLEISPETYLPLAEKYDMQDLKDSCSRAMARNLTSDNAVNTLIMADMYRCPDLKSDCLRRLREWRTIVTNEVLEPLKSFPELLLDLYRTP